MTPAEFIALAKAKMADRNDGWKFQDLLSGVRCSLLANINRSRESRPYVPADFMVTKEATGEAREPQSPEESMRVMDQWVAATGGSHG